jgi:hypothetical protein
MNVIGDILVLPNRLFIPIADPKLYDMTMMQFPRPGEEII